MVYESKMIRALFYLYPVGCTSRVSVEDTDMIVFGRETVARYNVITIADKII